MATGFGLIYYNVGGRSLEEFFDFAAASGFTHVEIPVSSFWDGSEAALDAARRRAEEIRRRLEQLGLAVSALGAGNDFVYLDEAKIAEQVARMEKVCELAGLLGTKVLRTEGGRPKDEVPKERWVEAMAGCLKRCLPFVERDGYYLAVDNHGHVTNDAELQVALFKEVGSKHVGANLDTMNYRWAGHSLERINHFYEIIAPYVLHTHFKDGRGSLKEYVGLALGEGEIDLDHAVRCLKQAGYSGVWTVEYEGKTDPVEGYRKGLAWLKSRV